MSDKLPANLRLTRNNTEKLVNSIQRMAGREVLAGFPEESTDRDMETEDETDTKPITNAALGYIHDNGAPEQNIPARPFMLPAMQEAAPKVTEKLTQVMRRVVTGGTKKSFSMDLVDVGLEQAGSIAELAIKNKINEGVPPPLAESTLKARAARGREGAKEELKRRAEGNAAGTDLAKPLVDTAQMRNAVKYVVRPRRRS